MRYQQIPLMPDKALPNVQRVLSTVFGRETDVTRAIMRWLPVAMTFSSPMILESDPGPESWVATVVPVLNSDRASGKLADDELAISTRTTIVGTGPRNLGETDVMISPSTIFETSASLEQFAFRFRNKISNYLSENFNYHDSSAPSFRKYDPESLTLPSEVVKSKRSHGNSRTSFLRSIEISDQLNDQYFFGFDRNSETILLDMRLWLVDRIFKNKHQSIVFDNIIRSPFSGKIWVNGSDSMFIPSFVPYGNEGFGYQLFGYVDLKSNDVESLGSIEFEKCKIIKNQPFEFTVNDIRGFVSSLTPDVIVRWALFAIEEAIGNQVRETRRHPYPGPFRVVQVCATSLERAFLKHLDGRILETMHDHGLVRHPFLYEWLIANGDKKRSVLRRQALEQYPVLFNILMTPYVTKVIDESGQLAQAIVDQTRSSHAIVKPLVGVAIPDKQYSFCAHNLPDVMTSSADLPPGHLPQRGDNIVQQWKSLREYHVAASWIQTSFTSDTTAQILSSEPPVWKTGTIDKEILSSFPGRLGDMIGNFGRTVLSPVIADLIEAYSPRKGAVYEKMFATSNQLYDVLSSSTGVADSALGVTFYLKRPFSRLFAIIEEYEKRASMIEGLLKGSSFPDGWPPLCDPKTYTTSGGKVSVIPLTTPTELVEEGKLLSHCVASYVNDCLLHGSHIVSLRDANGRSLSTAELRWINDEGEERWHCGQHLGLKNGPPPDHAAQAFEKWFDDLNSGHLGADPKALEQARAEREATSQTDIVLTCVGYDVTDPALRDLALRLWSFGLPKDERDLSHAEWVEHKGLKALLKKTLVAQRIITDVDAKEDALETACPRP
jgi:hypothetical protein